MRNLKLTLEYDGTNYCGWQVQSRRSSLQETIEKTLRKILQEKIRLIASGRTDAGVHALAQVANFKTKSKITLEKLQKALNGLLPDDIVVTKIEEAPFYFHSRFNAKAKVYRYVILNQPHPSVFLKNKAYFYPYPLDIKLMRQEARCLLGRHNFKSFCASGFGYRKPNHGPLACGFGYRKPNHGPLASGSSIKNTVRTIKNLTIKKLYYSLFAIRYPLLIIDIEADGFLYNMVRSIIGTLIEIGRSKFPKGSLKRILLSRDRRRAGPTVPGYGLCLLEVKYK